MYKRFFFLVCLIFFTYCKPKSTHPAIKKSTLPEVDLFLIPQKFNILESQWVLFRGDASFNKKELIEHLKKYGRSLEDLKRDLKVKYREQEENVILEVAKTSHSTDYPYDKSIPILFYGTKWFKKKVYFEKIDQQSIVPTLAKILQIRNPNGVETQAISSLVNQIQSKQKPELIVTIVIDQGGHQYYNAHPGYYPNIQKLREESAYFPNAEVGHLDAHTAVGHAAIGTGAYPRKNRVIGNTFFSIQDGKEIISEIYAGKDEKQVRPDELATETLADVLDYENEDKSEVISQCYALRASIGMAGHGAFKLKNVSYVGDRDYVYWIDKNTKTWTTDLRYYNLPSFISEYNMYKNYLQTYPHGWRSVNFKTEEELQKNFSYLLASPAQVRLEAEIFRRALKEILIKRKIHQDGYTDLAYLTLKATDAAGHNFGWESLEARDTLEETDRQVGLILDLLKKEWGDSFILVLTADHGCAPLPEISGGKRMVVFDFIREINTLLPEEVQNSNLNLVNWMTVGQVSLNRELMQKYNISLKLIKEKILNMKVEGKPFFKDVILKEELEPNLVER